MDRSATAEAVAGSKMASVSRYREGLYVCKHKNFVSFGPTHYEAMQGVLINILNPQQRLEGYKNIVVQSEDISSNITVRVNAATK